MQTKSEIRKLSKELRNSLDIENISEKIIYNLQSSDEYKNSKTIFCYNSFSSEVCTKKILNDNSKTILVPKVCDKDLELCIYNPHKVKKSEYGIYEPTNEPFECYENIDLIILPGLAFTKSGIRLGYGKGYYDRFIANAGLNVLKIGLVPDILVLEHIPSDDFDQKCDMIVTETGIINTKNI